jgi:hypothetical protein
MGGGFVKDLSFIKCSLVLQDQVHVLHVNYNVPYTKSWTTIKEY